MREITYLTITSLIFVFGCHNQHDITTAYLEQKYQFLGKDGNQLDNERSLIIEEVNSVSEDWNLYLTMEKNFADSLPDEQLNIFIEALSVSYSSNNKPATQVKVTRQIEATFPNTKREELVALFDFRDDIIARFGQLKIRMDAYEKKLEEDAKNRQAILDAHERESIEREQFLNSWLQEEQRQKERREDRIWMSNQLQNLRRGRGVLIVP